MSSSAENTRNLDCLQVPDESGDGGSNAGGGSSSMVSGETGGSRERRWDDPPEEKPPPDLGPTTTMILVKKNKFDGRAAHDIEEMHFTLDDKHLIIRLTTTANNTSWASNQTSDIVIVEVRDVRRRAFRLYTAHSPEGRSHCTFSPGPGIPALALITLYDHMPRLEVFDIVHDRRRLKTAELPILPPLAFSPGGDLLAGVSRRNSSRILVADVRTSSQRPSIVQHINMHTSPISHLMVTPDGTAIVSASHDGSIRMTSLQTGRTLRKAEVETRVPASIVRVSADGEIVASVWGRNVFVWKLKLDQLSMYNLDQVRQTEGWPLAISPNCQLLVCRTEDGVDVLDLETGLFRADWPMPPGHPTVSTAAVSHDGRWVTLGDYDGRVTVLEVITVSESVYGV